MPTKMPTNDESTPTTDDERSPLQAPDWLARGMAALEEDPRLDGLASLLGRMTPVVDSGRRAEALRGDWLGHALHPLMTDLPLGCWIGAGLLDLVGGSRSRTAAQRLVGLGLLFTPLTALSGLADWSTTKDEKIGRVGAVHAAANTAVTVSYLGSWRARRAGHHGLGVALGLVGGTLAWASGYLGGHLSFGLGAGVGVRGLDRNRTADTGTPQAADRSAA